MSIEETLKEKISYWSKQEFSDNTAEHLAVYYNALQAIQSNGGITTQESLKKAIETIAVGDSDFLEIIKNKNTEAVFLIMGELMETLKIINYRTYESVMLSLSKI